MMKQNISQEGYGNARNDAIEIVNKRLLFKRFMFLRVSIDGAALNKGEYRLLVGDCSGMLILE